MADSSTLPVRRDRHGGEQEDPARVVVRHAGEHDRAGKAGCVFGAEDEDVLRRGAFDQVTGQRTDQAALIGPFGGGKGLREQADDPVGAGLDAGDMLHSRSPFLLIPSIGRARVRTRVPRRF